MPEWLGWIASINPLTFAIEPIRMAYHSSVDLRAILIEAPYGEVNGYSCLAILLILTVGLFFSYQTSFKSQTCLIILI